MILSIPEGDFDAYIFDCDGTLADTMPLHYRAWCAALTEFGCPFDEALFYQLGGVPTEKIVEMLNERNRLAMPVKSTAERKEQLYLEMIHEVRPIEAVVEFMRAQHGKKPIAVASGGHREIVRRSLTAISVLEFFDVVIGSEDYEHGKPAPDPFLEAARRLNVAPEKCLVFEDTDLGVRAAEAAGMRWVLVPRLDR